jgi:hypothetical protein
VPLASVEDAEAVLEEAVRAYRDALGDRFVAAYALGSLAHGGFSPLVSDVDLGLIVGDPVSPSDGATVQSIAEVLKAGGTELHARLSVFWGTPLTLAGRRSGGRFPPLDRLDLLQHGRLMSGEDARAGLPPPSRVDLLVAGADFALGSLAGDAVVDQIRRPAVLLGEGIRHVTKLVLFPVRFLYTAETGLVGTNHAAAAQYVAAGDDRPSASLVAAALAWRATPPDDAEAAALLAREIAPLYCHYLDDHIARLEAVPRLDLADGFAAWRLRIIR